MAHEFINRNGIIALDDSEIKGNFGVTGTISGGTIDNASIDTDKFLVSDSGIIKYRTGTQVLDDIGAQGAGSYVNIGLNPADNRVGVWSDADTMEGDTNLTWNGSTLVITGSATFSSTLNSVNATELRRITIV